MPTQDAHANEQAPTQRAQWSWSRIVTLAGLAVLGLTPWAAAQQPPPNMPAFCPPLTAFATPTMFDVLFGTTPIRFPYQ
jgi:hypothetical protein